jgi:Glycine-rich domain-containing protein-like
MTTVLSISNTELAEEARKHIVFLKGLHALSTTLTTPSLQSLDRYLNYWLPLLDNTGNPDVDPLIPPPDIAWLWHCHRLAPSLYEQHVLCRFRKLLEAPRNAFDFQTDKDERQDARRTRVIWQELYPGVSFFLKEANNEKEERHPKGHVNVEAFLAREIHLLQCSQRQASFLWQVLPERFSDADFLLDSVQSYIRFLQLFGKTARSSANPNKTPLIPTIPIDLMWHTHILKSLQMYNDDCTRIAGRRFHHDDSLGEDRTKGGKLDKAFQTTAYLWKTTYGEAYRGMYRGEPPDEYWTPRSVSGGHPRKQFSQETATSSSSSSTTSSSSSSATSNPQLPRKWLRVGKVHEGKPTFIPHNPKHAKKKKHYVFGVPAAGRVSMAGYYHIYTKEGWGILVDRLAFLESQAKNDYELYWCTQCVCFETQLTPNQMKEMKRREKRFERLGSLLERARAACSLQGPDHDVLTPDVISKYDLDKPEIRTGTRTNDASNSDTGWQYHQGAACGGGG